VTGFISMTAQIPSTRIEESLRVASIISNSDPTIGGVLFKSVNLLFKALNDGVPSPTLAYASNGLIRETQEALSFDENKTEPIRYLVYEIGDLLGLLMKILNDMKKEEPIVHQQTFTPVIPVDRNPTGLPTTRNDDPMQYYSHLFESDPSQPSFEFADVKIEGMPLETGDDSLELVSIPGSMDPNSSAEREQEEQPSTIAAQPSSRRRVSKAKRLYTPMDDEEEDKPRRSRKKKNDDDSDFEEDLR
ncbi:hypothetical protein PRIPAC_74597, partial [Pristionchus pacificus]